MPNVYEASNGGGPDRVSAQRDSGVPVDQRNHIHHDSTTDYHHCADQHTDRAGDCDHHDHGKCAAVWPGALPDVQRHVSSNRHDMCSH